MQPQKIQQVVQKLQALPPNRINEVEDFIDFLRHRESDLQLTQVAMEASGATLQGLWENADDAAYDRL
ncbi:MAG: DUF2281 domain-containing protein [Gammaproteobacteria bacterium]|nr:DUF2281 domain-containing protein [Gammaproteobacteria bacterium]